MMDKEQCSRNLYEILNQETAHVSALKELLLEEKESIHHDADKLLNLAARKQQLTDSLESLHMRKAQLLKQYGYDATREGIESCLHWCNPGKQLENIWQALLSLLENCRNMNMVNGMIIEGTQHSVHQALSILYGQPQSNNAYSAAGKKIDSELSRSIGKA